MKLQTELYTKQLERWPSSGRVILAQYDEDSIIVYQAYRPSIGNFAAKHGYFGGDFKLSRMTWIKPNFLWMMYRSGWGTKQGQEAILAVRLQRHAFDEILLSAVHSNFNPHVYPSEEAWKKAAAESTVRLQWDPDHNPKGEKVERRAIQLGLRGDVTAKYAREWVLDIQDISAYVAEQREYAMSDTYNQLLTPREDIYPVKDTVVAARLGLSSSNPIAPL